MRFVRLTAVVALVLGVVAGSAQAASPASGKLLRTNRVITWSGGPFLASEPNYVSTDCLGGASDPLCDHFALTVVLGGGTQIEVSVTTGTPNPEEGAQPIDGDDYDLFVYAPNGALVAEAANTKGNESVVFRHDARFNGKPYEVRVHPWFVFPGSTYKGVAKALTG